MVKLTGDRYGWYSITRMPVTRSQNDVVIAAKALTKLKFSPKAKTVRPQRKAAIVARNLIKLCASSDNEDCSQ